VLDAVTVCSGTGAWSPNVFAVAGLGNVWPNAQVRATVVGAAGFKDVSVSDVDLTVVGITLVGAPINVFLAAEFPWAIFVVAGTGIGSFCHWFGYRHADQDLRRRQTRIEERARAHPTPHP
jgi:hypothetical protein